MAKTNGRHLSESDIEKIHSIVLSVETDSKSDKNLNPLHMFRGKLLNKTLIMAVCWITVCFGYYALTLNATKVIFGLFWSFLGLFYVSITHVLIPFPR
jgi:hypothetical protein